jgi:hypothetical protein
MPSCRSPLSELIQASVSHIRKQMIPTAPAAMKMMFGAAPGAAVIFYVRRPKLS